MFTLKAYDIGDVWGGRMTFHQKYLHNFTSALADFIENNRDPKAAVIPAFMYVQANATNFLDLDIFYDGATPPLGVFDKFFTIPMRTNSTKTRRYPDLLGHLGVSPFSLRVTNAVSSYPNLPSDNITDFLEWQFSTGTQNPVMKSVEDFKIEVFSMTLQPIPVSLQKIHQSTGPSAFSLDPDNGDKIMIEYDIGWLDPTCDEYCALSLQQVVEQTDAYQKATYAGIEPTHYISGNLSVAP